MSIAFELRSIRICVLKGRSMMADSYDREVVRQETTGGEPVRPVAPMAPVASVTTSRTAVFREGGYNTRAIQAVWWIVGFVDVLIAIRFVLKLFAANPAPFVRFMYDVTWPLVAPFHGIFNTAQEGRSILEPESLVAMAIYALIGWGIVSRIRLVSRPRSTTTVVEERTFSAALKPPRCAASRFWPLRLSRADWFCYLL